MTDTNGAMEQLVTQLVQTTLAQMQQLRIVPGTFEGTSQAGDGIVRLDSDTALDPESDQQEALHCSVIGPHPNTGARVAVALIPPMAAFVLGEVVIPRSEDELRPRVLIDSPAGAVSFLDGSGTKVGELGFERWWSGYEPGPLVQLDPFGGLRVWDEDEQVRVIVSASEGVQVRDKTSGITSVHVRSDGLTVTDPDTGKVVAVASSTGSTVPDPHWAATVSDTAPGTTHSTPAISAFDTGDDIDLRFVSASAGASVAGSYTPPGSYTERTDLNVAGSVSLISSMATRDPAVASPGVADFTCSSSGFTRRVGHSVIVRGGGSTSPAFGAVDANPVTTFTSSIIRLTIDGPATPNDGDILIAHISLAGPGVPVGWTVPEGWKQLGVHAAGLGSDHVLGSGIWYKHWHTGDPTSEDVIINMSGAVTTKVQATVATIEEPGTFSQGPGVMVDGRLMPQLIEAIELTADAQTVTFSNIPPNFDNLKLYGACISNTSADTLRTIALRFNGDSGANYSWQEWSPLGTNFSTTDTVVRVGQIDGGINNSRTNFETTILDYSRPGQQPCTLGQVIMRPANSPLVIMEGGSWHPATIVPVTEVQVRTGNAATQFKAGTKFWLYGE